MEVVCTLTSPGFWEGTGALLNSLNRCGYRGKILIGHRGQREGWAAQPLPESLVSEHGIDIDFREIEFEGHITYYKPDLMLQAFDIYAADKVYFFDSDIIVIADWDFFSRWADRAVALCQDISHVNMSPSHPLRLEWNEILRDRGYEPRDIFGFANGGFIGVSQRHSDILRLWKKLLELVPEIRGGFDRPPTRKFWSPFAGGDQSFLNMAIMAAQVPVSMTGQEGMSFGLWYGFMAHAIGDRKPWTTGVIRDVVVKGMRPSLATKIFWTMADAPIRVFGDSRIRRQRLKIKFASMLGRVIA